jgi:hypothetical protein
VRASAATAEAAKPAVIATSDKATQKPTVIVTGASSGLGLSAARWLAQSGDWHVVMACRDFSKAEAAAQRLGLPPGSFSVVHLDLSSLESVRQFVQNFRSSGRRLDALVCNAAVYLPTAKEPSFTADGFELSVGCAPHRLPCSTRVPLPTPRLALTGALVGTPREPLPCCRAGPTTWATSCWPTCCWRTSRTHPKTRLAASHAWSSSAPSPAIPTRSPATCRPRPTSAT